jgi:outer membrane protein OmpA-like peptidoglycan-associated protein
MAYGNFLYKKICGIKTILCLMPCALCLVSCAPYSTPPRDTWANYLYGASFTDMTPTAKIAKRPVYLGNGGKTITGLSLENPKLEYGDKNQNENTIAVNYMADLEYELYDALRKPGISVQRAGTDVVVILVRDALMQTDAPDLSADAVDTLGTIAKILKKYNATYLEIAGYTDSSMDKNAARALSLDMAQRVGIYLGQNGINTARMFIVGRGAARPIAAQDAIGRLTNRRVEIMLSPAR